MESPSTFKSTPKNKPKRGPGRAEPIPGGKKARRVRGLEHRSEHIAGSGGCWGRAGKRIRAHAHIGTCTYTYTHNSVSVGPSVGRSVRPWVYKKDWRRFGGRGAADRKLGRLRRSWYLVALDQELHLPRERGVRRAGCRHPATAAAAADRVPGGVGDAGGAIGRGPRRGLGSFSCSLVADL
jgi:hypothetical protein